MLCQTQRDCLGKIKPILYQNQREKDIENVVSNSERDEQKEIMCQPERGTQIYLERYRTYFVKLKEKKQKDIDKVISNSERDRETMKEI